MNNQLAEKGSVAEGLQLRTWASCGSPSLQLMVSTVKFNVFRRVLFRYRLVLLAL